MKALEAISILDCVEMAILASLERKESRWGLMHQRIDYPERDDENWLKYIVIKRDEEGSIRLEKRPVRGG
jgi:succinate dehydrogenase/fumarate reductase flavoprotein subunit